MYNLVAYVIFENFKHHKIYLEGRGLLVPGIGTVYT